ncbi:hypothetical protein Phi46:1_gp09 [Cellulophaga phage phi46:1]|nr:hypothetical protein Phi46:1_gp09 [Cellulophaga phage phi46:1]AGO47820.1 hypothetical protein Phi46:1_gp09 [Cellulophaga phage phi46:1]
MRDSLNFYKETYKLMHTNEKVILFFALTIVFFAGLWLGGFLC